MRALARWVSILVTVAAGALAALVVLPPPTKQLAFLAIFVDEKTFVLAAAVLVAALLAQLGASRRWVVAQRLVATIVFAIALVPPVQAAKYALAHHVAIDVGRYLTAPVDDGPAHPSRTLVYATVDGQALALDVYRPTGAAPGARAPAVIVVHGGGWSADDKGGAPLMSARLAARGYAVFDVQYRIAPQPNWRTAVGDVKCAIGWVKRHAREAGVDVDPARVTLLGRSAGGHLALLAAYAPDAPALPRSCDAGDTHVAAVISFYGPTDLTWAWAHPTNPRVFDVPQRVGNFVGGTPATEPERFRLLSPINHVTTAAPPTLLIQGGSDAFVSAAHAERLSATLAAAHVPHELLTVPYAQHAFDFISGGLAEQLAEQAVLRFLAEHR